MPITSQTITQVKVHFTVREGDHEYTDALYFTQEEYAGHTPEAIEALQQQRFDNWKAVVTAPPRVPTVEEVQAQFESLVAQQEAAQQQITALLANPLMADISSEVLQAGEDRIAAIHANVANVDMLQEKVAMRLQAEGGLDGGGGLIGGGGAAEPPVGG